MWLPDCAPDIYVVLPHLKGGFLSWLSSESDMGSSGTGAILILAFFVFWFFGCFFFFFGLFAVHSLLKITESNPVWVSITGK